MAREIAAGGWIILNENGMVLFLRLVRPARDQAPRARAAQFCPVHAVERYVYYAKINAGPLFRRTTRDNNRVLDAQLSDKHAARLIKQTVLAAGLRSDLPEKQRLALFSGQSLRAARP